MNILAIDTAYGSCAVTLKTATTYHSANKPGLYQQTALLLPSIDQVLAKAQLKLGDLDAIAFSAGPASFTGIRLALSAAQGLALADNLPIIAVNSLQALAQDFYRIHQHEKILVCTNAYMGQLYWAGFSLDEQQNLQICYPQVLINPHELPIVTKNENWARVGNGWEICQIDTSYHNFLPISAVAVADLAALALQLGIVQSDRVVAPIYLRTAAAWKN